MTTTPRNVLPKGVSANDFEQALAQIRAIVGAELVFHLAADMGGVGYFHSNADLGASLVNGQITLNVAQAVEAHETPTTFYASSACAYPVELQQTPGEAPALSEDLIGHGTPDALYGAEKLHGLRIMGKVRAELEGAGASDAAAGAGKPRPTGLNTKMNAITYSITDHK